jgi:hypothetical protein
VSSQRYRIFEALQDNREKRGSFVSINCSLFTSPKDEWRCPQSQPAGIFIRCTAQSGEAIFSRNTPDARSSPHADLRKAMAFFAELRP